MYETFKNYGEIDEVVIPSKRDVRGRRYGFARYFKVRDKYLFSTMLNKKFIGNRNLYVNIPRFKRRQIVSDGVKPLGRGKLFHFLYECVLRHGFLIALVNLV